MTSCDHASVTSSRFAAVARGFVIFAYGLFSISAQTLIFREFITSFESNDITIGIFFGCWFIWIALGAVLVNKSKRLAELLLANIEMLLLAYLPAFILEVILIIHIRGLAGVAPYVLLPIPTALLLGAIVSAPVSLITGLLFPLTCRWVQLDTSPAVSRVYLLESLGSFIGGLWFLVRPPLKFSLCSRLSCQLRFCYRWLQVHTAKRLYQLFCWLFYLVLVWCSALISRLQNV
jgi:hypothetical protein